MNNGIAAQVIKNTNEINKLYNQRKAVVARQYGEEHDAIASNGNSMFYLCHDVDTEYIAEYKFKLVITGDGTVTAEGIYLPSGTGTGTYPTIESWIAAYPIGSAVDVDGIFGAQCYDYANAYWRAQVNRGLVTNNGGASGTWNMRSQNAGSEFDLITSVNQIKRGDWIVWYYLADAYGHIAMAAEDYDGSGYITCYGQNQNGVPMPRGGKAVDLCRLTLGTFSGAFRYKGWH